MVGVRGRPDTHTHRVLGATPKFAFIVRCPVPWGYPAGHRTTKRKWSNRVGIIKSRDRGCDIHYLPDTGHNRSIVWYESCLQSGECCIILVVSEYWTQVWLFEVFGCTKYKQPPV